MQLNTVQVSDLLHLHCPSNFVEVRAKSVVEFWLSHAVPALTPEPGETSEDEPPEVEMDEQEKDVLRGLLAGHLAKMLG